MKRTAWPPLLIGGLCLAVSGCITQPSKELTTAPTDATSDLTNGTSNAIGDIVRATSDFASSTTPKSWFSSDGTLKAEHKIRAFTVFAFYNLKQDIAQGSGEYLASFATLVGVPTQQHAEFFRFAQGQYGFLYADDIRPAESVNRLIKTLSGPA